MSPRRKELNRLEQPGSGRPTDLTDELLSKIKECILDGKNFKDTAEEILTKLEEFKEKSKDERIKELANFTQKLYTWHSDNYLGLAEKIIYWKQRRIVNRAVKKVDASIDSKNEKISLKAAQFILETLDKENFSKRVENTGADGKAIEITGFNFVPNGSKHTTNDQAGEGLEDTTRQED